MLRLLYNTTAADGRDIDALVGYAYDATMAYFHAVDFMIKQKMVTVAALNSTRFSGSTIKQILASNVSFAGVTGHVDFSSGRIGSKTYGYGDRHSGQAFDIWNFHNNATWGAFKRIGLWTAENHYRQCDVTPNPYGDGYVSTPEWMGGCNLPMQTSLDDHVTLLRDRNDDIIQLMPASLKVCLFSHDIVSSHS